ncbi:unnamed protein product [Menidia menidia]|uniref:(Atlantic silverside) hypothetical protein n=1 Tax=Menidia menidia TaxID=238744 RepID=A0A8S4A6F0_9TELE|nr:unnamed protein product [Menidia menidia]
MNEIITSFYDMETQQEEEPSEEAVSPQLLRAPERRHVDDLLDISEEDFIRELEPCAYVCYSGVEEAVSGWARAAPLSCILMTQSPQRKPKQREADSLTPLSVNPSAAGAHSSAGPTEQHCQFHAGPHNFKKPASPKQQTVSWGQTDFALLKDTQKNMAYWLPDEKTEVEGMQPYYLSSKYSVLECGLTKPQKSSYKPNNTTVPIKNFTFLPPITVQPAQHNRKVSRHTRKGKKAQDGETFGETFFMFGKRSGAKGTQVDTWNPDHHANSAALDSIYQTCQDNPHLFPACRVTVTRKSPAHLSPKPETVQPNMGKMLLQEMTQRHLSPSCLYS